MSDLKEKKRAAKKYFDAVCNYEWHFAAYRNTTPISAALFKYLQWYDCGAGGDFVDFRDEVCGERVLFTNTHKHYTDPPELVTGSFPNFEPLSIANAYDLWKYCVEKCIKYGRNREDKCAVKLY